MRTCTIGSTSAGKYARLAALALSTSVALLSGCTSMMGRPTSPLVVKREIPGVVLCMSERSDNGGLRIVGKVDPGIYPITKATIQYRLAGPSDPVPADAVSGRLELAKPRSETVPYRKGSNQVSFSIDGEAVRALVGKVIWYRWTLEYSRGGSSGSDITEIHRTSLEEAGLPRAPYTPGPDASVAPATHRR
ncbi:MAG TPA: hypothetical protein VGK20_11170 [Candidatus Binatia bacterium]|jgi:hypothetical protein